MEAPPAPGHQHRQPEGGDLMPGYTLKSLAKVIPAEHAPIALAWFAQQPRTTADLRDAAGAVHGSAARGPGRPARAAGRHR